MSAFKLFGRKDRQDDDDDTIVTEGIADLLGETKVDPTLPLPLGRRSWAGDDDGPRASEEAEATPGDIPQAEFPPTGEEIELAAPIEFPMGVPAETPEEIPAKDMEKEDSEGIVIVDDDSDLVSLGANFGMTTSSLSIIPEEEASEGQQPKDVLAPEPGATEPMSGDATQPMSEFDRILMAPFRLELDDGEPAPEESIASSLASIASSLAGMRDDIRAIRHKLCDNGEASEPPVDRDPRAGEPDGEGAGEDKGDEAGESSSETPDGTTEEGDARGELPRESLSDTKSEQEGPAAESE